MENHSAVNPTQMPFIFAPCNSAVLYSNREVLHLAGEDVLGLRGPLVCGVLTQHPILSGNSPGGSLLRDVRFGLLLPNESLSNSVIGGSERSEYGPVGVGGELAWESGTDRADMPASIC